MSNVPRVDGKKMIKILRKAEFEVIRIKGSHHFFAAYGRAFNRRRCSRKGNNRNQIIS